jgi:hypothetical protein
MVFTCAMPTNARAESRTGISRRSLLSAFGAGAVAITVSACSSDPPPPPKTADQAAATNSLGPLYTETLALITMYDGAIAANGPIIGLLGPLREETRQHAVALAALMNAVAPQISAGPSPNGVPMPPTPGPSPATPTSATPSPTPDAQAGAPTSAPPSGPALTAAAEARSALMAAEKTAQANATTASLAAPDSQVAVLASIAASRATHVAALA